MESCFFGAGLVEEELTDDYRLFANGYLQEMSIWKEGQLIVDESVFAYGYDDDFIIVLSHPKVGEEGVNKDVTFYNVIDLDESVEFNIQNNVNLDYNEFTLLLEELNVDRGIQYKMVFENFE